MIRNIDYEDEDEDEKYNSIWSDGRSIVCGRSCQLLQFSDQSIHDRLINIEDYCFDLTMVYNEHSILKRRPLWAAIRLMYPIFDANGWLVA